MAAVFPGLAQCQENQAGPIEIPDHPLVRQTLHDCLHEAMDVDALAALLTLRRGGRRAPAPARDDRALAARARDPERPALHVPRRRAARGAPHARRRAAPRPSRDGARSRRASIPRRSHGCARKRAPAPRDAEELHDTLLSLVVAAPRAEWEPGFEELVRAGRAARVATARRRALVRDRAARRRRGACSRTRASSPTWRSRLRSRRADPRKTDAGRGAGRARASRRLGSAHDRGAGGGDPALAGPGRAGARAPRGRGLRAARALLAGGGRRGGGLRAAPARAHPSSTRTSVCAARSSRSPRRTSCASCCAGSTWRPGRSARGGAACSRWSSSSRASSWRRAPGRRRCCRRGSAGYRREWLDGLCLSGEVVWARLGLRPPGGEEAALEAGRGGAVPSRATPIAFALREELPALLAAARGEGQPTLPGDGAARDLLETLRARGALFHGELVAATRRLPVEVEQGLWDLVSRGLVTADGFESRARAARRARARAARPPARTAAARLRAGGRAPRGAGRCCPRADLAGDPDERAEAVAEQLLARWGVVFRDLLVRETLAVSWREILWALRRLEARGAIRGGRFVTGFVGEQYALPGAVEALRRTRRLERTGEIGAPLRRRSAESRRRADARAAHPGRAHAAGGLPRRSSAARCARGRRQRARHLGMSFLQDPPRIGNQWREDRALRRLLGRRAASRGAGRDRAGPRRDGRARGRASCSRSRTRAAPWRPSGFPSTPGAGTSTRSA